MGLLNPFTKVKTLIRRGTTVPTLSANELFWKTDTLTLYIGMADGTPKIIASGATLVSSVNGRSGAVTGLVDAVTGKGLSTNDFTDAAVISLAGKEDVANKDTDGTLAANSDTKYASQKATKNYNDVKSLLGNRILTPPILADFTWLNQGSYGSADNTYGGIHLLAGAVSGHHPRVLEKAASLPFTLEAAFTVSMPNISYCGAGICIRDSTDDTKIIVSSLLSLSNGAYQLQDSKFSGATLDSEADYGYVTVGGGLLGTRLIWLRIVNNASGSRYFYYSGNGIDWILYDTRSYGDQLVPNRVGIFVDAFSATYATGMHCLHFLVT